MLKVYTVWMVVADGNKRGVLTTIDAEEGAWLVDQITAKGGDAWMTMEEKE